MKYGLTILISMVLSFDLHAQTYTPFPGTSAYWVQYVCGPFKFPYDFQIGLEDSIEIDGLDYRIMTMFYSGSQEFYLREDSLRNVYIRFTEEVNIPKLYFQNYPLNQDLLLYSFNNLHENDTIFYPYANSYVVVNNIDSVLIFDSYRKRYEVEVSGEGDFWGDDGTWIEGIGDTHGLLKLWQWDFEWIIKLCDYGLQDTAGDYSTHSFADCEFIGMEVLEAPEFLVYPNPFSNSLKYDTHSNDQLDMKLFDQYGRQVKEYNDLEPSGVIDLSDIAGGHYLLQCRNERFLLEQKIIVKLE